MLSKRYDGSTQSTQFAGVQLQSSGLQSSGLGLGALGLGVGVGSILSPLPGPDLLRYPQHQQMIPSNTISPRNIANFALQQALEQRMPSVSARSQKIMNSSLALTTSGTATTLPKGRLSTTAAKNSVFTSASTIGLNSFQITTNTKGGPILESLSEISTTTPYLQAAIDSTALFEMCRIPIEIMNPSQTRARGARGRGSRGGRGRGRGRIGLCASADGRMGVDVDGSPRVVRARTTNCRLGRYSEMEGADELIAGNQNSIEQVIAISSDESEGEQEELPETDADSEHPPSSLGASTEPLLSTGPSSVQTPMETQESSTGTVGENVTNVSPGMQVQFEGTAAEIPFLNTSQTEANQLISYDYFLLR